MSEREPSLESGKRYEIDPKIFEDRQEKLEKLREAAAEEAEAGRESPEKLQERAEQAAQSGERIAAAHFENAASESPMPLGRGLEDHAYKQNLRRAQKSMSAPQRQFSQFIHKRGVETASNIGGATVARPSGLLAGGLFSVLSSLAILYICRHYGYEYNFLVGLVSFAGGFILGILVEGLYKLAKR